MILDHIAFRLAEPDNLDQQTICPGAGFYRPEPQLAGA